LNAADLARRAEAPGATSASGVDPAAEGFWFSSFDGESDRETVLEKQEKLNDQGALKTSFTIPQKDIAYGQIIVESGVRDDRGKTVASEARADYAGVDRFVGLKQTEWVYDSGRPANILSIVTDEKGKPVGGVKTHLLVEREEISTASVKGAGSAYLADNTAEWQKVSTCSLRSGKEGQGCAFTPEKAGAYRVTASVHDTKGREHKSTQQFWVSGGDYVQWNEGREYALPLTPEKAEYKVGDTARYLIQNPWPGVQALVSVERYGVMDSYVTTLEGSTPVIEIPVKENYLPGFFVSVVAFSPRVDAPPPQIGQIDMGKPAFRVGYARTPVVDPYKEMVVTAKASQDVYRPRDTVNVSLNVKPKHGEANQPVELAVAVLDEAVFDLITAGRDAFDPYHGFYDLDALDVENYSLLTRLIGRQKFERKGANPGGDGGVDLSMRDLFKFVSYWNPSVPVDKDGNAQIEFSAPDNLTGWRVLAIATTKDDLMGLGDAGFKVNRPTEIRPVMPNQVREGDAFNAGFSVMNRTDRERTIRITIDAEGNVENASATQEKTVTLAPYKRETVYIPLKAAHLSTKSGTPDGGISFRATAGDDSDMDGVEHRIPVLKARSAQTSAVYGSLTGDSATQKISLPDDMLKGSATIGVTLSPTILSGLDGAFAYMRDYPYPCWEQKLSMAVMASNYGELSSYVGHSVSWPDAEKLPNTILSSAASYQTPGGGMAYFVARDEYADPYLSAYTALAFGWLKKAGHKVSPSVEEGLQKYILSFLRNKSAPSYYTPEMIATTRAVILAAYAENGKISADDINRFRKDLKVMSLFGKAHFLMAAQKIEGSKAAASEAKNLILSSAAESSGTISFNDTVGSGYDRILGTPTRDNCAVLTALTQSGFDDDKASRTASAIVLSRKGKDAFQNTQENVICTSALLSYARAYESVTPDMEAAAKIDKRTFATANFTSFADAPVSAEEPLDDKLKDQTLALTREGDGRLYYNARLRYEQKPADKNVNAGIDVTRAYSVKTEGKW
ncbi:MAG: large extracellular alpha-helical protein, partial [Micavibrio aeruginosavorus]